MFVYLELYHWIESTFVAKRHYHFGQNSRNCQFLDGVKYRTQNNSNLKRKARAKLRVQFIVNKFWQRHVFQPSIVGGE